ncbi:MAG: glycine/sarcosine/betaine reductase selenoprotein B family protein [Pseudomonadota bacterium]
MVRLSDLPDFEARHLLAKNGALPGPMPWVADTRPASERRFVIITTAGIHPAGSAPFASNDASYRVLPGDAAADGFAMSHASVNFDRSGFQRDVNVVFPVDRFRELEESGQIAGLASRHYSFMGAGLLPEAYEDTVTSLAGILKQDRVDTAFLTPV